MNWVMQNQPLSIVNQQFNGDQMRIMEDHIAKMDTNIDMLVNNKNSDPLNPSSLENKPFRKLSNKQILPPLNT
jgi:hypothetical protein